MQQGKVEQHLFLFVEIAYFSFDLSLLYLGQGRYLGRHSRNYRRIGWWAPT